MNDLARLQADLEYAAQAGAEKAGELAVGAGVDQADSAGRALVNVESVNAQTLGPLHGVVTATSEIGTPVLPSTAELADTMAGAAAAAGAQITLGHK